MGRWVGMLGVAVGFALVSGCADRSDGSEGGGTTGDASSGGEPCGICPCDGCPGSTGGSESSDGPPDPGSSSGHASSSGMASTSDDGDASSTTGDPFETCDCADDEICVQYETTDACIWGPVDIILTCKPRPATCDVDDPCAATWCTMDLCSQTSCTRRGCGAGQSDAPVICGGLGAHPCHPYAHDCPKGEKCVPIDDQPDGTFDTTQCVLVQGELPPGSPCTLSGLSEGNDDCDATSWCAGTVDQDGVLVGTCRELCGGTVLEPTCPEGFACDVQADGFYAVCLPV